MTEDQKGTILVVDDTPANLGVLFKQLDRSGFKVLVAQDGHSALRQAQADQPDIILLDVLMPDIDGFETCRRLKENEETRDIPVIFMTALTDVESKVAGFEVGGVDYVTKPIQWQEVLMRITTHLTMRNLRKNLEAEVAERKQAQTNLAQERNMLRTLIDNIPDYIYVKDTAGQFMLSNIAFARAIGAADIVGRTEFDFRPESAAIPRQRHDQELLETGQPVIDYEEHERENHHTRWFLTTKVPLRNDRGQIAGLINISRDITERKRREEALHRQTRRLQLLHEIDREILAGRPPAAIAQTALRYTRDLIPCQRASLLQFEAAENPTAEGARTARVLAVDVDGETRLGAGTLISLEISKIMQLKKGRVQVDILALSQPSPVEQRLLEEGVSVYINVPLIIQDELVGALNLGARSPDLFTSGRLDIAEEVAVPLTLAIVNNQ